ncbi:MAG: peptidylprolyl isomerase [Pseudobdellovibrionaceae bacterium]
MANQKNHYTDNSVERLKRGLSTKNIIAFVVFGMIIVVFALFGLNHNMGGTPSLGYAASINGKVVTINDFESEIKNYEQYYQNLFGSQMDFGSQRQLLAQQAMESLVRSELMLQASEKQDIYATDGEVREYLLNDVPYLQENGFFSRDYYTRFLQFSRMSPGQFENKIRKQILALRTRQIFEEGGRPSNFEKARLKELKELKINLAYVQLSQEKFGQKIQISNGQMAELMKDSAFESQMKAIFEKEKASYSKPAEVKAQHILISANPEDAAAVQKAEEKIKSIAARLQKEDFAKLAREMSDDPGSKQKGGDLGFFSQGKMVPEFDSAVFKLKVGEVSAPVKTQFGFHLIKLNEKRDATEANYENLKLDLAKKIKAEKDWSEFSTQIDQLVKAGDESAVQVALDKHKITWDETGYFDFSADFIPKLTVPQSEQTVLLNEIHPQQPFLKRVLREGSQIYIVKFKDKKTEATTEHAPAGEQLAEKRRADQLYEQWVNDYRKQSEVKTNTALLAISSPQ